MKFWVTTYDKDGVFCFGIVFAFRENPKELSIALGFIALNFSFGKEQSNGTENKD